MYPLLLRKGGYEAPFMGSDLRGSADVIWRLGYSVEGKYPLLFFPYPLLFFSYWFLNIYSTHDIIERRGLRGPLYGGLVQIHQRCIAGGLEERVAPPCAL